MLKKLFNRKPSDTPDIDSNAIPKHVAIIMDGNGRWAKRRGNATINGASCRSRRIKADYYCCR